MVQSKMAAARGLLKTSSRGAFSLKIRASCPTRSYATAAPAARRQDERSSVIITENDPDKHLNSHQGFFYSVPQESLDNILTHVLPKRFLKQSEILGGSYLMVRNPALSVIKKLKKQGNSQAPTRFVLHGDAGCGKTLTLSHIVHYATSAGWFVLLVPSVFSWVHSKRGVQMSKSREDRFDQPEEAASWLRTIRAINGPFLANMQASQQYEWGKLDSTKKGEPLISVIDQGLKRINYAPDAVGVVLKEIKQEPGLKILYAADEYNGFFGKTSFKDSKQKWIQPQNLSLVHHFTKLIDPKDGLKSAAMVFALSRTGIEKNRNKSSDVKELLGEEGEDVTSPYTSIHVPAFSMSELENFVRLYQQRGGFQKDLTSSLLHEIALLTGGSGHLASLLCGPR
ncbi:28S ribosomal protein S29, mitochondrial [Nematostella vectensis]|uniref:28S ribosomal protein S29, mitochondrial n=1 Tax=Nematostella vectensis TaxID=45351 RepID=UPI0020772E70|nr:28S ribosomal protein S29, mitochondrial [Nematostella vectensis]